MVMEGKKRQIFFSYGEIKIWCLNPLPRAMKNATFFTRVSYNSVILHA